MSAVVKHLFRTYRWVYVWFWGIAALTLAGIAASFEVFGHYTLDDERVSVWETVGTQGPRWFLFVMGIMFATVSLPVAIASGLTRRTFYRGAMVFGAASAVLFGLLMLAGFGVERIVYTMNGMMAGLTNYPVSTWGQAAEYGLRSSLSCLALVTSGWMVGLIFYRYQVWVALILLPLAVLPVIGGMPVTGTDEPWFIGTPLTVVLLIAAAVVGYAMVRSVPVKPKKA
jgi:hypothetical protein